VARCERHAFELAVATCDHCVGDFCPDCLVYAQGPSKAPLCMPCALVAAGVRRPSRATAHEARRRRKTAESEPTVEREGEAARSAGKSVAGLVAAMAATAAIGVPVLSRFGG
jgi:hypothetical protein